MRRVLHTSVQASGQSISQRELLFTQSAMNLTYLLNILLLRDYVLVASIAIVKSQFQMEC